MTILFRKLSKPLLQRLLVNLSITLPTLGVWAMPLRDLHDAVADGDVERVQQLIAEGVDMNALYDGTTPLHRAVARGHLKVVRMLLSLGADIEARSAIGTTPLYWAAEHRRDAIVEALCNAGANVNTVNPRPQMEDTPLHEVAGMGCSGIVRILLATGADIEAEDFHENTPLYRAAKQGHLTVVQLLAAAGATISQHIINRALMNRHYEVARFLIETRGVRVTTFHERLKAFPLAKQKKLCNDLLKITAEYVNCNWPRSPQ